MAASHKANILVLGSVNIDLVVRGPRLPQPGETVLGGTFFQAAGGKGANQAVAAARLGASVTFLAAVGDDDFGRLSLAGFEQERLDCRHVLTLSGEATGTALILVDHQGENMISVASGANAALSTADIDRVPESVFRNARVFLTNLETPLPAVVRGLERAKAAGMITILNPAPALTEVADPAILRLVDVITPNEGEAVALFGDSASHIQAATALRERGVRSVVITLAAQGCLVLGEKRSEVPGIHVEAVDATAAGDAFNGALAVALAEGFSLEVAAEWANRAAALSVTRAGAQPSLPRRSELDSV